MHQNIPTKIIYANIEPNAGLLWNIFCSENIRYINGKIRSHKAEGVGYTLQVGFGTVGTGLWLIELSYKLDYLS